MSSYIAGAVIGAGAVLAGVLITIGRDSRIRKEERNATKRRELQQAMQEYLAALDALMLEADDFPVPIRQTRVDRWVAKEVRGTTLEFLLHLIYRLLKRVVYGHRHDDLSDRLVAASAHLRLVAPPAVEQYMVEGESLGKEHRDGDEQWKERWKEFRSRMRTGFREALDDPGPTRRRFRLRPRPGIPRSHQQADSLGSPRRSGAAP